VGVIDNKEGSALIRIRAAKALALFAQKCAASHIQHIYSLLLSMLASQAATDRQSAGLFVSEWAELMRPESLANFPSSIVDSMLDVLNARNETNFYYAEVLHLINDLRNECASLLVSFQNSGVAFNSPVSPAEMSPEQMNEVV